VRLAAQSPSTPLAAAPYTFLIFLIFLSAFCPFARCTSRSAKVGTELLRLVLTRDGAVRFEVRATPRARTSAFAGVRNGALAVRIAAPPADGAANDELVATLANALGLARRDVVLVRGGSSRDKLMEVRGLRPEEVQARLNEKLGSA
jgi:uncharacterized protein (TIGR00251 family)